ncbi:MAG: hypothetical protein JWQ79_346 [Mucilaginibacter sp.]|nr:hypothetical protein [Mucilaginibacter sp.]
MKKVLFEETQSNTLLVIMAVVAALFFSILCMVQIGFNKPFGNHPAPDWVLILFAVASIAAAIFFNYQKLKLLITEDEIHVSFGLLTGKTLIRITDIKSISIRQYDAFDEFLGWGIRYNATTSCFTVSGNKAIEVEMTDNRKILIGTQKATIAKPIIEQLSSRLIKEHSHL